MGEKCRLTTTNNTTQHNSHTMSDVPLYVLRCAAVSIIYLHHLMISYRLAQCQSPAWQSAAYATARQLHWLQQSHPFKTTTYSATLCYTAG